MLFLVHKLDSKCLHSFLPLKHYEDRKTNSDVQISIIGRYFYYQVSYIFTTDARSLSVGYAIPILMRLFACFLAPHISACQYLHYRYRGLDP